MNFKFLAPLAFIALSGCLYVGADEYYATDGTATESGEGSGSEPLHGPSGTTYQRVGNTTFGSDGTSYQRVGNTTFGSDGTSYQRVGNTTFGSDGSVCQKIGSQTFCN